MNSRSLILVFLLTALVGCLQEGIETGKADAMSTSNAKTKSSPPNFIIIIGDDMGVETLRSYGVGDVTASTPNLDRLAESGIQFNNYWAQPACSPTRATLLTGRYGFRTGVLTPGYPREDLIGLELPESEPGAAKELHFSPRGFIPPGTKMKSPPFLDLSKPPTDGLPPEEITLPQLLKKLPARYATAAVGKWHLEDSRNGWLDAPKQAGFDYYSGMLMGEADSHYQWVHASQGEASIETGYIDERAVEDGVNWLQQQAQSENPWLLWVAFVNPHTPVTLPPERLLNSEKSKALSEDDLSPENTQPYVMAMMEAMDALMGRLLNSVPENERANTYIIFMGDNGSVKWAQPAAPVDADRAKMTVYEGGIRVPLIIAGPGIPKGETTPALANSVDIMATVLELAGAELKTKLPSDRIVDSKSMAQVITDPAGIGPRQWIYADTAAIFTGGINYAIRDHDYKLVMNQGKAELYKISADPWEKNNLLVSTPTDEDREALSRLQGYVNQLKAETK